MPFEEFLCLIFPDSNVEVECDRDKLSWCTSIDLNGVNASPLRKVLWELSAVATLALVRRRGSTVSQNSMNWPSRAKPSSSKRPSERSSSLEMRPGISGEAGSTFFVHSPSRVLEPDWAERNWEISTDRRSLRERIRNRDVPCDAVASEVTSRSAHG